MIDKKIIEDILNYSKKNNISEKESCKHFNFSQKCLYYYKKKYGFEINDIGKGKFTHRTIRKYKVNDNFFEVPNILNCYWAGFISADGCIFNKHGQDVLSIALSSIDKNHLKRFIKDIEFEGDIKDYCVHKEYNNEKKVFKVSSITITSQKISDDLNKNFNIIPKKSLILLPPNITDNKLIDAFICGYIDGDGSISLCNSRRNIQSILSISLLGTKEMCEWIKSRYTEILNKKCGSILKRNKENNKNTYSYTITSKCARKIFLHFYNIDVPKLSRKWSNEKYEYCFNFNKKKPICKRKGVNVFDLNGNLLKHFDMLSDASNFTKVSIGRISDLCKINDCNHMAKGYMFSRDYVMNSYMPLKSTNKKYLI